MKKNMVYMTATENGILVAVKTKLSNTEMTKIRCNEERVNNVLEDINAELIFCEPNSKDYNFSIGSYSNGEVSMEDIRIEVSKMMNGMDEFKDWLKTVEEEPENRTDNEEMDTEMGNAIEKTYDYLIEKFPNCGFCIIGVDTEHHTMPMVGNIDRFTVGKLLTLSIIADAHS